MNKRLDTNKIRIAQVRYYDTRMNGAELSSIVAYAFLYQVGEDQYINLIDPTKDYAVFDRTPYSNVLKSGLEYGTRIVHKCGKIEDGICYVMDEARGKEIFGTDSIDKDRIESYIMNSDYFFLDRPDIMKKIPLMRRLKYASLILADSKRLSDFYAFIDSHDEKKYMKRYGN